MNIGIIGIGVVGKAIKFCFEMNGFNVIPHDIILDTKIEDILSTEICYICVPTPSDETGKCDISIVESVIKQLSDLKYRGVIAIKSTVQPGTTDYLSHKYGNKKICHVPEFLRERCAISDFIDNHDVCVIGTVDDDVFEIVKKTHGSYPKTYARLSPTQSELLKYFHNIHNATMITLANCFYEISNNLGVDYTEIKDALTKRSFISDLYLTCNKNFRGFGGACLPKDTMAMDRYCKDNNIDIEFFETILNDNKKFL